MRRFSTTVIIAAITAWALPSACRHLPISGQLKSLRDLPEDSDFKDLENRLSPGAEIYLPGDAGFDEATLRWSIFEAPDISVVVVPSVEEDVAETVRVIRHSFRPAIMLRVFLGKIRQ